MKFDDLPTDIVDRILIFIPDLSTLSAALLTSKEYIYNVYQAHPNSIFQAVAYNITGPALSQALRVAKFEKAAPGIYDKVPSEQQAIKKLLYDKKVTSTLLRNAKVVNKLEAVFSRRNKDRTSTRSVLTDIEAKRFHRAVYRIWALVICQETLRDDTAKTKITEYIGTLPMAEVLELDCVREFFEYTRQWTYMAGYCSSAQDRYVSRPNYIAEAYENADPVHIGHFYDDSPQHLDNVLSNVLTCEHKLDDKKRAEQREKAILDSVIGETDTCYRCNAVMGSQLWGSKNWDLLQGHVGLATLLRGNLCRNMLEHEAFRIYVNSNYHKVETEHQFSDMIEAFFDIDSGDAEDWDKTKWYCFNCMLVFMKRRAWKWWYQQKQSLPDYDAQVDCWYGYNCRTQTHRLRHAQTKNHLCVPIRGDPHPDELELENTPSSS